MYATRGREGTRRFNQPDGMKKLLNCFLEVENCVRPVPIALEFQFKVGFYHTALLRGATCVAWYCDSFYK